MARLLFVTMMGGHRDPCHPHPCGTCCGLRQELSKAAPWCLVGAQTLPQRPQLGGPSSLLSQFTPLPEDFQASPARARLFSCFSTGS